MVVCSFYSFLFFYFESADFFAQHTVKCKPKQLLLLCWTPKLTRRSLQLLKPCLPFIGVHWIYTEPSGLLIDAVRLVRNYRDFTIFSENFYKMHASGCGKKTKIQKFQYSEQFHIKTICSAPDYCTRPLQQVINLHLSFTTTVDQGNELKFYCWVEIII